MVTVPAAKRESRAATSGRAARYNPIQHTRKEDQPVKTALLEGKKPAHFDKHIIGNLLLDVAPPDEVKQEKMLIGVRNEAGEIYRLIGATKINSFMNAVEELFDLGLVDELQDTEEPKDGCDAIFSEP